MYSRFLWSVHTKKGWSAPSNQCLHSSSAALTANSFFVTHIVVPFCRSQLTKKIEGCILLSLANLCDKHHKLPLGGQEQYRCGGKLLFEALEGFLSLGGPLKRYLQGGDSMQRGSNRTEIANTFSVKLANSRNCCTFFRAVQSWPPHWPKVRSICILLAVMM